MVSVLRNPFKDDDGDLRLPEAKRDRYWTKDEFETLLAECADHLRPIVFTAVASGIRRGNLLALTWDMVDFDRECIGLPEGMMKNDQALNVPITYSLKHVLKAIRKSQLEQHLATGRSTKPPKHVFTYRKKLQGRMVASPIADIKTAFQAARRRAKLDDIRFHDSRHTHATHLRDAGVDMHMIGSILGHSWTNMTQRYAHENWEPKKEAISHIEQLIADSAGTYWRIPAQESNKPTAKQVVNA